MTQDGFENYLYGIYGHKNGTAMSYITAIRIIDQMFEYDDVFGLNGQSVATLDDVDLLTSISEFIYTQQTLYKKGENSIFSNVKSNQKSYPGKGFCSAGIRQLQSYFEYEKRTKADLLLDKLKIGTSGAQISKKLIKFFDIDKKGSDKVVETRVRIGQDYFRKKILEYYEVKCCVTGLNIPQTLRASHIVAWADDKMNRMNPENGLCLSATYDAAFDKHLISFDEDYRMIVSKEIKDYYTNEIAKKYFGGFEGKQIIFPILFRPSQKFLAKHRELLVG